jgi:glutamine amidotransferase
VNVAIIDYGSGNLHSAAKAFERAARESGHAYVIAVTNDPEAVRAADRVVLPGVGAFADCRRGLDALPGMVEALTETVRRQGRPFLGICVGMQLLAERGREYEVTDGLGWIAGEVCRIEPGHPGLKIPHMGWNRTRRGPAPSDLLSTTPDGSYFYFVHSYFPEPARAEDVALSSDHGQTFCAAVARDNIFACQFHPEKSQAAGLALIARFVSL